MPGVLSTLRLGELRQKNNDQNKKPSTQRVPSTIIVIEMREVQNSCRPLPNANNLSKNDVMVAHNEVKILLPPISGSASLQGSEETLIEVSHEDELQMHQSNSMLSVNAPEFTPQSKANSSQSSLINSPFESVSSEDSEDFKTSNEPYSRLVSSMTLPCIGCDNKLRQYLWKIDKVGDLLPLFNHSIPPPRIVAHRSFFGPSIIIPVCSSFKRASGGLIINQLQQMSAPAEEIREKSGSKIMVNASVTAHPTDLNTPITLKMCEVASQTDDGDLNEDLSLNPHPQNLSSPQPSTEVLHERYSRDKLIELMDKKLSIVAPILKRSVHKLLSNSSSSNLLVNTLTRDETLPQDTNLLRKSSTMTTFDSSIRNEIFLVKSFSLDLAKHDKAGDGWIQTKDGAEALKMFRSCLNKLTVDNFDVILAEVKMMRVSDDETILSFIKLLYEKAIIEPTYANHYVQLTMALKNIFTIGPGKKTFDYFAIVACQTGFEEAMQKLMNVKTMSEDDKDKLRRGLSGSIQFIAKMYLNRILNSRIITEICEELLKLECVESIEPLCKLLEISGAEIESAQLNNDKMNKIMKKLSNLAKIFPTRNKFMIQNLIEQRQNGWKPRFSKDGPKKLDQVAIECGFVKRLGVVGRYDELQSNFEEEYRPMTRNDNFNRNDRGNHGNHSRSFRGQRNRHGKPFRAL